MASVELLVSIGQQLSRITYPLQQGLASQNDFSNLMLTFGWVVDPNSFAIADVRAAIPIATDLATAAGIFTEASGSSDYLPLSKYLSLVEAMRGVVATLGGLKSSPPPTGIAAEAWATFTDGLFDALLATDLEARQPRILAALILAGIVTEENVAAGGDPRRVPYLKRSIDWSSLGTLVTNPGELGRQIYDWKEPGAPLNFDLLFQRLGRALPLIGLPVELSAPTPALLDAYYDPSSPYRAQAEELTLTLMSGNDGNGTLDVSLFFFPIPETGDTNGPPQGLALGPAISTSGTPPTGLFWPFDISMTGSGGRAKYDGSRFELRPSGTAARLASATETAIDATIRLEYGTQVSRVLVGSELSHRLELNVLAFEISAKGSVGAPELVLGVEVPDARLVVDISDADSFLGSAIGGDGFLQANLGAALTWSSKTGFHFRGSGGMEVDIPLNLSLAGVTVTALHLRCLTSNGKVDITAGVAASLAIGPVSASVDNIGAELTLTPLSGGNSTGLFGSLDFGFGFKPPSGVGIAIKSGPVSGGGFISFDPDAGRYSGALELSIYSVAVKAFGLIETKLPDGSKGFSFVIVISAEFTPIQLGLGFTLNGVGGLIGINRTVDGNALANLVRAGASEELLFPKNLVANAPAIIRDLGTVFPAREGHYVFGPMAKLGWGTPTLIQAEIGIFLELPGPVLSLLGEVKCVLPKPEAALVKFNLSVSGQLDFPHRSFSMDASLHDSVINGFPVSGQMAMRLRWGEQANFALSIGGFHPAYKPPPDFPKLQPMALELSRSSSVSVAVSGFFAVTSNTLQIGGQVSLHASGAGLSFDAKLSVKALFVFSPFSFVANIDASVKVSFHGHGPSVHLSGLLSGPSPWRVKGQVCVSILFWDACLRFDKTFGGNDQVSLPEVDPWLGSLASGSEPIQGLRDALRDQKNWTALPPAGAFATVSLGENSNTFVDPLGGFSVRQKAVPVETKVPITRFGAAKAAEPGRPGPIKFNLVGAALETVPGDPSKDVPLVRSGEVKDQFAAAQFFEMNDAKKLSAPSFEKYDAGYSLASNGNNIKLGKSAARAVDVQTLVIAADGTISDGGIYQTPAAHIEGLASKSAVALGGSTQGGTRKYIDAQFKPPFELPPLMYVLASTADLKQVPGGSGAATRTEILILLDEVIAADPAKRMQVQIVPQHELAA